MLNFILRRLLFMIPILLVISLISFVIIQLPPGDYVTRVMSEFTEMGTSITADEMVRFEAMRIRFGLDEPIYVQYFRWITRALQGDFGFSFEWNRPVSELIWSRLGMTLAVTGSSMLFTWVIAFPVGFYSAVKQYSIGDYLFSALGFIGLATPNFMLALVLMYLAFTHFGLSPGALFSVEYATAPWSIAKLFDFARHVWVPMVVVGTAGTAGLIRVLRNNLLDELQKPYVVTARAKGLTELRLLFKYPVRIALNPFLSTVGWLLPNLISGVMITAIVLNLPTAGPLFLQALMSQDMYLAGAFVLILATLTVIGTLLSDILLAVLDPRIRYD